MRQATNNSCMPWSASNMAAGGRSGSTQEGAEWQRANEQGRQRQQRAGGARKPTAALITAAPVRVHAAVMADAGTPPHSLAMRRE